MDPTSRHEPPAPTPLEFERTVDGAGLVRLAVAGEIDFSNSDALRQLIDALLGEPGLTGLAVDLDRLRFIDSSGVRALIAGRRAARQRGVTFGLVNPTHGVRRVLQILGVDGMLALGDEPD